MLVLPPPFVGEGEGREGEGDRRRGKTSPSPVHRPRGARVVVSDAVIAVAVRFGRDRMVIDVSTRKSSPAGASATPPTKVLSAVVMPSGGGPWFVMEGRLGSVVPLSPSATFLPCTQKQ